MGTRSGDCDPGMVAHMADRSGIVSLSCKIPGDVVLCRLGVLATDVVTSLNKESGFLGIAGTSDSR